MEEEQGFADGHTATAGKAECKHSLAGASQSPTKSAVLRRGSPPRHPLQVLQRDSPPWHPLQVLPSRHMEEPMSAKLIGLLAPSRPVLILWLRMITFMVLMMTVLNL